MPVRRCAGCGRIAPKSELVRLAFAEGQPVAAARLVVRDRNGKLPGRGAYLCRERDGGEIRGACLSRAQARDGIARTLRAPAKIDPELVQSIQR